VTAVSEKVTVSLTLNGENIAADVGRETTLLRFLRDEMGLTGTKEGCGTGHCGACLVLVNGRPVKSCLLKLTLVAGKRVETIEGLRPNGELHPVQAAFLAAGAVQCGFCTPGMIMAAKGLLAVHPDPTDEEIREGLGSNICRCTGYVKVIAAVKLASRWMKHPEEMAVGVPGLGLGRSVPDLDGEAKVKGRLLFAGDMYFKGMLYGKVLWSEHPHAEILAVDAAAAKGVPGVAAVLTAGDVPGRNGMGSLEPDQPVLCGDRVRFTGDAVAVVFADSMAAAEQAVKKIKVDYRALPGVFTPGEGLAADSPRLHERGNICKHLAHREGNVERALEESAVVVGGRFETPCVEHAYLEPEAAVGTAEADGSITVYAPTQFPFEMRQQLAAMLDLPEEKVRVIATPIGGGFGSKLDNTVEALAALGAYHLKRPVRITLTRGESLRLSTKRHPFQMDYRVGFDSGGKITAVDAHLLADAGPYTALSPRVIDQACLFSCGPYRVPNLRVEGWAVHTNNANSSAFRGFGINQVAVAMECLLDEAARALGLDPFTIRAINALGVGDRTAAGEILKVSVAMGATIEAARDALEKEWPAIKAARAQGRLIGVGVASGFKNVGAGKGKLDDAGAIFALRPGGRIHLRASAVDMGQGIRTALLQVASQVLAVDERLFDLVTGDTASTIPHGGAVGERQVFVSGKAVELAAREFKKRLLQKAAAWLGLSPDNLALDKGAICDNAGHPVMTLENLAARVTEAGELLEASYYHTTPKTYALADKEARESVPAAEYRNYPAYAYATQVAVVEVDRTSGRVKVLRLIAAHDCGRAINPQKVEGQIEGSCLMGLGYALSESYKIDRGIPKTKTFGQLGVPTVKETPEVTCILIEDPDPGGPFGAKGIAEMATVPVTPAILNSIYDATGVRIRKLPATPEKVLAGMTTWWRAPTAGSNRK